MTGRAERNRQPGGSALEGLGRRLAVGLAVERRESPQMGETDGRRDVGDVAVRFGTCKQTARGRPGTSSEPMGSKVSAPTRQVETFA